MSKRKTRTEQNFSSAFKFQKVEEQTSSAVEPKEEVIPIQQKPRANSFSSLIR